MSGRPLPFELWREDDNGQRFLVSRYQTLDAAKQQLAVLTRTPHRQTYWIVDIEERKNSR